MSHRPKTSASPSAAFLAAALLAAACATQGHGEQAPGRGEDAAPPIHVEGSAYEAALRVKLPQATPLEDAGLHNVFQLSRNVVSGSEPHGEEAFQKLHAMGVRTLLSVDGKIPDRELAGKYGMTYVHVPTQYRGMSEEEILQIAKTFRELPGPFYVHCFHGKHRGPAAAAIGRLVLDGVSREQALAEMRQWCGTAPSYEGLYRAVADAPIPAAVVTGEYAFDFPAAHAFAGLRQGMVEAARADDNLKLLKKRGWAVDPAHPDVDPLNEAEKLAGTLKGIHALDEAAAKPADFRGWMDDSVRSSAELVEAVRRWRAEGGGTAAMDAAYGALAASCSACHEVYRND